jgi:Fe-S-cluster-containing hydrogenase component 2
MPEITINKDVCRKDSLCAMACIRTVFHQEEKNTVPVIDRCFGSGHCVAICPQGAISHTAYPKGSAHPISPVFVPNYAQIRELIRSRRSKRLFKEKTVKKVIIEKVVDAARVAPSGHNEQSTGYIVQARKPSMPLPH